MVNIEPHIEVYDVQAVTSQAYGNAGKIAVIGAFPSADFKLGVFARLDDAMESVKGEYRPPNELGICFQQYKKQQGSGKCLVSEH